MTSILLEDLFLIVYVLVNDWYQTQGKHHPQSKPGVMPEFTDSEVISQSQFNWRGAELALVGGKVAPVLDPD
jgi:hypothetical protein